MSLFLPRFFMPSFLSQKNMLNNVYPSFTFSRNFGISNVFFMSLALSKPRPEVTKMAQIPSTTGLIPFVDFFPLFAPPPGWPKTGNLENAVKNYVDC